MKYITAANLSKPGAKQSEYAMLNRLGIKLAKKKRCRKVVVPLSVTLFCVGFAFFLYCLFVKMQANSFDAPVIIFGSLNIFIILPILLYGMPALISFLVSLIMYLFPVKSSYDATALISDDVVSAAKQLHSLSEKVIGDYKQIECASVWKTQWIADKSTVLFVGLFVLGYSYPILLMLLLTTVLHWVVYFLTYRRGDIYPITSRQKVYFEYWVSVDKVKAAIENEKQRLEEEERRRSSSISDPLPDPDPLPPITSSELDDMLEDAADRVKAEFGDGFLSDY